MSGTKYFLALFVVAMISVIALVITLVESTQPVTPKITTVTRNNNVTIVELGRGTKLIKFDDGRIACFDEWGNVCTNFNANQYVPITAKAEVKIR